MCTYDRFSCAYYTSWQSSVQRRTCNRKHGTLPDSGTSGYFPAVFLVRSGRWTRSGTPCGEWWVDRRTTNSWTARSWRLSSCSWPKSQMPWPWSGHWPRCQNRRDESAPRLRPWDDIQREALSTVSLGPDIISGANMQILRSQKSIFFFFKNDFIPLNIFWGTFYEFFLGWGLYLHYSCHCPWPAGRLGCIKVACQYKKNSELQTIS